MKWVNRIIFTLIYITVTFYLLLETAIPPTLILLVVVILSPFISRYGILADLEKFFKKPVNISTQEQQREGK